MREKRKLTGSPGELMLLTALAFGLSGCEERASIAPRASSKAAALEERLGDKFVAVSRADPNSKPLELEAGDLPPVSLTEQPVDF